TIFDKALQPLAERLTYINNSNELKLSLNKDTVDTQPQARNVLTLGGMGSQNKAAVANLSVSVVDAETASQQGDNICSYFLMSSELQGYIHQPGWYFKNNSDSLKQQLDLVMLTHAGQRFN